MPTLQDAQQFEQAREYLKAAELYQELGNLEKAKALCLKLERHDPFHPRLKFTLGKLLTQLEKWDEAIVRLQKVGDEGTAIRDETLYLLARCFTQKGLIYAAKEMYAKLLEYNSQYKDAREKLRILESPGLSQLTTIIHPASRTGSPRQSASTGNQAVRGTLVEDRYVLIEELGRGGMGIVYKAEERVSHRLVAIKVLPPYLSEDVMSRVRFFREADIVANLHHPHIVRIIETNQLQNFLVMEYISGGTLNSWRTQHPNQEHQLLRFIVQILEALHVVHEQGIIHRDMKPENILIAGPQTAKLTDFGIAHICGATITYTGTHLGTLPYMSPEQVLGEEIDRRSDIYGIGVMLYEVLTGELPFTGGNTSYDHIHTLPRAPCVLSPNLAPELSNIILKCLAKHPKNRYQDGQALRDALLTYLTSTAE